jgi:hypothetical protein
MSSPASHKGTAAILDYQFVDPELPGKQIFGESRKTDGACLECLSLSQAFEPGGGSIHPEEQRQATQKNGDRCVGFHFYRAGEYAGQGRKAQCPTGQRHQGYEGRDRSGKSGRHGPCAAT